MRSGFRLPDLSLRARLLLLLVALATVGLAMLDFASYRALHDYLFDRVDQQLEAAVETGRLRPGERHRRPRRTAARRRRARPAARAAAARPACRPAPTASCAPPKARS